MKIRLLDLPRALCHHAVGKDHTHTHRMVAGMFIMAGGVGIAKAANLFDGAFMHYSLDMVGYAIHGLGALPYIEYLIEE